MMGEGAAGGRGG